MLSTVVLSNENQTCRGWEAPTSIGGGGCHDMIEWSKKGGYQGATISFYDYNNGKVYEPFQKQRNVLYGIPVYLKKSFWFFTATLRWNRVDSIRIGA